MNGRRVVEVLACRAQLDRHGKALNHLVAVQSHQMQADDLQNQRRYQKIMQFKTATYLFLRPLRDHLHEGLLLAALIQERVVHIGERRTEALHILYNVRNN